MDEHFSKRKTSCCPVSPVARAVVGVDSMQHFPLSHCYLLICTRALGCVRYTDSRGRIAQLTSSTMPGDEWHINIKCLCVAVRVHFRLHIKLRNCVCCWMRWMSVGSRTTPCCVHNNEEKCALEPRNVLCLLFCDSFILPRSFVCCELEPRVS